jgi:hypothetical protein
VRKHRLHVRVPGEVPRWLRIQPDLVVVPAGSGKSKTHNGGVRHRKADLAVRRVSIDHKGPLEGKDDVSVVEIGRRLPGAEVGIHYVSHRCIVREVLNHRDDQCVIRSRRLNSPVWAVTAVGAAKQAAGERSSRR